jgi:hypothetical protein
MAKPILGSLQVGAATRFASNGQPVANSGYAPDVSQAQLESPPAPGEYAGLKSGPEFGIEYEANQTTPIDGSKDLLRVLSPFMIQVEPPLITGSSPNVQGGKKDYAGIYGGGHSGAPGAFNAARNRIIQDIPGGDQMSNAGSVDNYVAAGLQRRGAGGGSERTIDVKGEGPTRLGAPAIADVYTAVDITMQLRALVNTPPLILLINPQSLSMNYTKIQQFSDRTRYGFVFQAWGEEQPKLTISAKCGAFITSGKGVQWASRRDSASWQNLATAFQFYRHNGYIYDTVGKSNAHHMVGALSIHYDGWVYYGNMESFSYAFEEETQLGGIVFEMEFTVNAMVDTTKQSVVVTPMRSPTPSRSDPRYQGFENRALPSPGDVSVGQGSGVHLGGHDFYSLNGVERPSDVAPDGTTSAAITGDSGGQAAPKSSGGFQSATAVEVADAPAARPPTPFGVRR